MHKIINPVERDIKKMMEIYENDIFNLNHCIDRNKKENKLFRTELREAKAKLLALQQQLNNLK